VQGCDVRNVSGLTLVIRQPDAALYVADIARSDWDILHGCFALAVLPITAC
jgi:hypothetical protein